MKGLLIGFSALLLLTRLRRVAIGAPRLRLRAYLAVLFAVIAVGGLIGQSVVPLQARWGRPNGGGCGRLMTIRGDLPFATDDFMILACFSTAIRPGQRRQVARGTHGGREGCWHRAAVGVSPVVSRDLFPGRYVLVVCGVCHCPCLALDLRYPDVAFVLNYQVN